MHFENFSDFVAMGGHGLYVWIAYGLTAVVLILNVLLPMIKRKRVMVEQVRQMRREEIHASGS